MSRDRREVLERRRLAEHGGTLSRKVSIITRVRRIFSVYGGIVTLFLLVVFLGSWGIRSCNSGNMISDTPGGRVAVQAKQTSQAVQTAIFGRGIGTPVVTSTPPASVGGAAALVSTPSVAGIGLTHPVCGRLSCSTVYTAHRCVLDCLTDCGSIVAAGAISPCSVSAMLPFLPSWRGAGVPFGGGPEGAEGTPAPNLYDGSLVPGD